MHGVFHALLAKDVFSKLTLAPYAGFPYTSFTHADMAQLVEHHLAKVGVAGSNPVVRSMYIRVYLSG